MTSILECDRSEIAQGYIQSINQYPFIVWYNTSNIPADKNAFGIYMYIKVLLTGFTKYTKRMLVIIADLWGACEWIIIKL